MEVMMIKEGGDLHARKKIKEILRRSRQVMRDFYDHKTDTLLTSKKYDTQRLTFLQVY